MSEKRIWLHPNGQKRAEIFPSDDVWNMATSPNPPSKCFTCKFYEGAWTWENTCNTFDEAVDFVKRKLYHKW